MKSEHYTLPLTTTQVSQLKAGDSLLLSGKILVMRDAAHKRICDALATDTCEMDFAAAAIYYMGPCPAKEGEIIGSCGPTTSSRMDSYAPMLYDRGVQMTIGKGGRNSSVIASIIANKALYLIAIGGAGALYKAAVKSVKMLAFPDLGAEALLELTIENFPAIVAIDSFGNNIINC